MAWYPSSLAAPPTAVAAPAILSPVRAKPLVKF